MKELFEECVQSKLKNMRVEYADLISGDIHREVGGYPSNNHRMPLCCNVMRDLMRGDDTILQAPPKGNGATLTIRYYKRNR